MRERYNQEENHREKERKREREREREIKEDTFHLERGINSQRLTHRVRVFENGGR